MYIMDHRRLRMMALPINQNEIPHNLLLAVDCYIDWADLVQDQIRICRSTEQKEPSAVMRDVRQTTSLSTADFYIYRDYETTTPG